MMAVHLILIGLAGVILGFAIRTISRLLAFSDHVKDPEHRAPVESLRIKPQGGGSPRLRGIGQSDDVTPE